VGSAVFSDWQRFIRLTLSTAKLSRLDRVLALLPASEAAWLRSLVEPPWLRRQRRLQARDEAVCGVRLHFPDPQPCCAAKAAAAALRGYLTTGWLREREQLPDGASEYRRALWVILTANDGKALSWRRILEIWAS
jgi:hypothetical protein